MARGKFNKRVTIGESAVSAEEIELRNARLAEVEERRAQRRADEDEDGDGEGGGGGGSGGGDADKKEEAQSAGKKSNSSKPPEAKGPAVVTTQFEHNKNLAKLAEVKRRREVAEAKRKQEQEAEELAEAERKAAALTIINNNNDDDDKKKKKEKTPKIPKLDKIAIKKMKPAQMKDALKERGLEIQGNAKALTDRLLKYEAERS